MLEEEDAAILAKKAVPVLTDRGVMTAIKNRKGVFKITSMNHDYFMSQINTPNIPPYLKNNKYEVKDDLVSHELDIIKESKEMELLEESFDEEDYLEETKMSI